MCYKQCKAVNGGSALQGSQLCVYWDKIEAVNV